MCVIYTYLSYTNTNTNYILCVFPPQKVVREEDLLECQAPFICMCHLYISIIRRYEHRMYSMRVFARGSGLWGGLARIVGSIYTCVSYIHIYHTPIQTQNVFYACFRPKKWCVRRSCSNGRLFACMCVVYTYLSYTKKKMDSMRILVPENGAGVTNVYM